MADSPQIPFVGGSYQLARKKADDQRTINMMVTAVESGTGKSRVYLQSAPGLTLFSVPIATTYVYTSLVYPTLVLDSMSVGVPSIQRGTQFIMNPDFMNHPVPAFQSGTLAVSISYKSYTGDDAMTHPIPVLQSGTLVVTAVYYTGDDAMNQPVTSLQSGTLVVTIEYVNYTNQRDLAPDTMNHPVTSLQSGTLA